MTSLRPLHQYLGLLIVLVLGQFFITLLLLIDRDKVSMQAEMCPPSCKSQDVNF